jgi:hypothetical protein
MFHQKRIVRTEYVKFSVFSRVPSGASHPPTSANIRTYAKHIKKISRFFHEDTHRKKPKDIYITLSNSYSEGVIGEKEEFSCRDEHTRIFREGDI